MESNSVRIETTVPGSTVVYFTIENPTINELDSDSSDLRRLSGNDKMLVLYQWYVDDNERLDQLDFQILDYKLFAVKEETENTSTVTSVVVELFHESAGSVVLPPSSLVGSTDLLIQNAADNDGLQTDVVTIFVESSSSLLEPTLILFLSILLTVLLF